MKSNSLILYLGIPAAIFVAGFLFSCENDLDSIERVTFNEKTPSEVTTNLELIYTDSGYAQVRIRAELAETYMKPSKLTKLKDGLEVEFYSYEGKVVSILTALYGEIDFKTGIVVVRDSVILRNLARNQVLATEELFYNQVDSTIYTDRSVTLHRNGKIGRGDGIRTTQSFDYYKVTNPVGEAAFAESDSE